MRLPRQTLPAPDIALFTNLHNQGIVAVQRLTKVTPLQQLLGSLRPAIVIIVVVLSIIGFGQLKIDLVHIVLRTGQKAFFPKAGISFMAQ